MDWLNNLIFVNFLDAFLKEIDSEITKLDKKKTSSSLVFVIKKMEHENNTLKKQVKELQHLLSTKFETKEENSKIFLSKKTKKYIKKNMHLIKKPNQNFLFMLLKGIFRILLCNLISYIFLFILEII